MKVRWTDEAQAHLESWTDYLAGVDERLARRARDEAYAEVGKLERRFALYRASRRWPGTQEMLLDDWSKLVVYQVTAAQEVLILGLYDQRQDLSRVNPLPE